MKVQLAQGLFNLKVKYSSHSNRSKKNYFHFQKYIRKQVVKYMFI